MFTIMRYARNRIEVGKVQLVVGFLLAIKQSHRLLTILGSEAAERQRMRYPIHAFVGENGSGKTNTMVRQAMRALSRGRTVISNVPLYANKSAGELHPLYIPFDSWSVLKDVSRCVIMMDEMVGVANARENAPIPQQMQLVINQLRKRRITLLWASPVFEDAQIQIRRVTRAVTVCEGSWSDKEVYRQGAESDDPEFDEGWIPNRLFRATTYRKTNTPDFTPGLPVVDEWYWGPGSKSFDAYDTNEETTRLAEADDAGLCMDCFGMRRRDECNCADYVDKKQARKAARLELPAGPGHAHHAGEPVFA